MIYSTICRLNSRNSGDGSINFITRSVLYDKRERERGLECVEVRLQDTCSDDQLH